MITYEKKQHKKDGHEFIEITGYEGTVSDLVIPREIDGLKVEAIGNHAFSGRQDIVSIKLPESIRTLYGFAFHNSRNLRKISLYDSLDDYYDGVCRQCDSLEEVEITVNRGWFEVIRNFLADNDKTLKFMIHTKASDEGAYIDSCLTFPEYVYDFNENTMARTIQFSIAGAGMFYRECVDRRKIGYRQYDMLFDKAVIDGGQIPEDIAIGRLLYPVELEDTFKARYEAYLKGNSEKVLHRLIREADAAKSSRNTEGYDEAVSRLSNLLSYSCNNTEALFVDKDIDSAIRLATTINDPVISAVLMDREKGDKKYDDFFL